MTKLYFSSSVNRLVTICFVVIISLSACQHKRVEESVQLTVTTQYSVQPEQTNVVTSATVTNPVNPTKHILTSTPIPFQITPSITSQSATAEKFPKITPTVTLWGEWMTQVNNYRGIYSSDYTYSATAIVEKTILTDLEAGIVKWEAVKPPASVNCTNVLLFSRNNKWLANGGCEEIVYIYQTSDGALVNEILFGNTIGNLSFSANNRYLAIGTICGEIQPCVITVVDLLAKQEMSFPLQLYFSNLAFSPQDMLLAIGRTNSISASSQSPIILWDIENQNIQELPVPELENIQNDTYPKLMAFSPNGQLLGFITNISIQIWDMQQQEYVKLDNNILEDYPLQLLFSPNGQYVSILMANNQVHIWSITGNYWKNITGKTTISKILFTPDSNYILLLYRDGSMESINLIPFRK